MDVYNHPDGTDDERRNNKLGTRQLSEPFRAE